MDKRKLTSYEQMIREATGAPLRVLPILENIMLEDIFHSTLDWQTREQFDAAAREAWDRYRADPGLYDAEHELTGCFHRVSVAEGKQQECLAAGDEAGARKAEAEAGKWKARRDELMLALGIV